jgi:putative FmdB family regulatory protein
VPTYQYQCTECGDGLEVVQKFTDDSLTECPGCQGRLKKVFSAVGIVFKGSGFYRNDSRGSRANSTSSASGSESSSGSAESSGSGSSESSTKSESKDTGGKSDKGAKGGGKSDSKSSATSKASSSAA